MGNKQKYMMDTNLSSFLMNLIRNFESTNMIDIYTKLEVILEVILEDFPKISSNSKNLLYDICENFCAELLPKLHNIHSQTKTLSCTCKLCVSKPAFNFTDVYPTNNVYISSIMYNLNGANPNITSDENLLLEINNILDTYSEKSCIVCRCVIIYKDNGIKTIHYEIIQSRYVYCPLSKKIFMSISQLLKNYALIPLGISPKFLANY